MPGNDGAGEAGANSGASKPAFVRTLASGGAGLLEDMRLLGISILDILLC